MTAAMVIFFDCAIDLSVLHSAVAVVESSPEVGSSRNSTLGSVTSSMPGVKILVKL